MSSRKIAYGAAVLVGLAFAVTLRQARRNDVDLPAWFFVAAAVVAIGLIALDIRSRRSKAGADAARDDREPSSGPSGPPAG